MLQNGGELADWADTVTEGQIRYIWHTLTCQLWLRDKDAFVSATKYADECVGIDSCQLTSAGYEGLVLVNKFAVHKLSGGHKVEEMTMDATYGTNSAGYSLFAVLAEVDGTGVPLAYMFAKPTAGNVSSYSTPLSQLLFLFLKRIQDLGFAPSFFGCDKDMSEIIAISNVFPRARIQLCYWHVLRAIRAKLSSSKESTSRTIYDPVAAKASVPELELCWGSRLEKRPSDHKFGEVLCACPSRRRHFTSSGNLETSTMKDRQAVIDLIHLHFNYHPRIPFAGGLYKSANEIYQYCTAEMYNFCRQKDWWRTWVYFWGEWYRPDKWRLWARSVGEQIPVLKTTMVLESHWRVLKHDFLHKYNRPRIDLVVHCMATELLPTMNQKLQCIISGNQRLYRANWRLEFKQEWLKARQMKIGTESNHFFDGEIWVCSCRKYILSRFLICKHLVQAKEAKSRTLPEFFRFCHRIRISPFWVEQRFGEHFAEINAVKTAAPTMLFEAEELESGSELGDEDVGTDEKFKAVIDKCKRFAELIQSEQQAENGSKFIDKVLETTAQSMDDLLSDEHARRNSKTMNTTWRANKHPASIFMNSC